MKGIILNEASSKRNTRKYKCPYCDKRFPKEQLITHIEGHHEELIPEGYTAARIVFNIINKKEVGHCVQCKKETQWNEETWRYERFCSKKCSKDYSDEMKQRMVRCYGKEHLLNEPDQQDKMLKGRHISGIYRFTDGGRVDYVGSYEKKLLEFMDKVLNVSSMDIMSPGPTIEYMYDGKKHFWITDFYYVPYNLVFDVKDGGDNPNTRDMEEYRAKQFCKEDAIKRLDKYNYIRLTNNNFQQLLLLMSELKMNMMDETNSDYIIRINEFMPGIWNNSSTFVAKPSVKDSFADSYITDDELKDWYKVMNNKLVKVNPRDIIYETLHIFKYKKDFDFKEFIERYSDKELEYNKDFIYETLTGKNMLTPDQIIYDTENFEEVKSVYEDPNEMITIFESSIEMFNKPSIPILEFDKQKEFQDKYPNLELRISPEGYFALNTKTQNTTPYVENTEDLKESILIKLNNF